ncbi:MAG: hypothetical protein OXU98_01535 [Gammaproteobacteria bacterium]|nr:hypothetical protein [Gammaproteobacteria bacterium]
MPRPTCANAALGVCFAPPSPSPSSPPSPSRVATTAITSTVIDSA